MSINISSLRSVGPAGPSVAMRAASAAAPSAASFIPSAVLRSVSAPPLLNRLELPEHYLERLQPGLELLGFAHLVGERVLPGPEPITFRFTQLKNGSERALLYLADEILTTYSRAHKLALDEVRERFQSPGAGQIRYQTLYVFHDSNPSGLYKNLLQGEWPKIHQIDTKFIPTSDLDDLEESKMTLEQQVDYLKRELDLGASADAHGAAPPAKQRLKDLPGREIGSLLGRASAILADLPEFQDEDGRSRRAFMRRLGYIELADSFRFAGAAKTVAFDWLFDLPGEEQGPFLAALLAEKTVPSDDREFLSGLLERYSFN